MDCVGLSVFAGIATGASLAQTARRLRITPMSATRRLAALERELGVRLVHRTTRAISLTNEGLAFLPHAHRLIEAHEAARASVRDAGEGANGLLRITSSIAFGRKIVAPMLVDFLGEHPALSVDLLMTDCVVDIVSEGLDLAIRIADLADNRLIARRLAPNPRVLLATAGYLAQRGTPQTMSDLDEHECLALSGVGHWAFEAPDGHGTGSPIRRRIGGRFTASSIEGLLQACLGGLGIANLSAWFVRDELARGLLQPVRLRDAVPQPLSVWAVHPSHRMVPPKSRLFIDALGQRLRGWPA